MQVLINQQPHTLPDSATLADALRAVSPPGAAALATGSASPPFAAAVNQQFVPRALHATHRLQPGDRVDLIVPVTGG